MTVVQQNYGEKVLVQGTTAVDLVGLVAALNLLGGTLVDHIFLFLGVGLVGTGIVELIALEMSKQVLA
ncbi:unnamed protein product [Ilex paraguariensis]|uniref:Malic enzyme NAD-binding domain-containing protein n=1 Tax=Ilex paraguariensis TaxID=185542 RepID=A0ABC8STY2_9AQUA